jgi:hypothetical protein
MHNGLLESAILVFVRLQVLPKRPASDEVGQLLSNRGTPGCIQKFVRHPAKIPAAWRIGGHRLNKGLTPEVTITVKKIPALPHQVPVAKVEWTIEIPQIEVAKVVKNSNGVIHASG